MLKDKVYQMFILGTGSELDNALKNNLGGVIFFTKDIQSENQFKSLIQNIKIMSKTQPFLSIDQEGGKVERTENIHSRYLSPKFAFEKGSKFLYNQSIKIASELCSYGLNMNFAPCIDVNSNPNNPIIGERAFSDNPDEVCHGFDLTAPIYSKFGIIPVIKHFPGHGDADKDSHKELPIIDLSLQEMEDVHIYPFKYAVNKGADAVMVAHLNCSCFGERGVPTSLSKNCITYLRDTLGFNGVVVSDDMVMNGLSGYDEKEACILGIKAGINLFIYREANEKTLDIIEYIVSVAERDNDLLRNIEISYDKILNLKQKYSIV